MKVSAPTPPPPPAPVDPGQSALSYINAMADPALQQRLLGVEQEFRPQYTALNLQDINQYMTGVAGQPGALDMLGTATQRAGEIQAAANTQQRAADIADVERLGPAAAAAFKAANPDLYAQLERTRQVGAGVNPYAALEARLGQQANLGQIQFNPAEAALLGEAPQMQAAGYGAAMGAPVERVGTQDVGTGLLGQNLYQQALGATGLGQVGQSLQGRAQNLAQSTGQLSANELRNLQQSTRAAYTARGTEMGSASVSAEALARLTNERQRMMEDLQAASALNQATQAELTSNRGFQQSVQGADIGRQFGNQAAQMQAALANQGVSAQQAALNQAALNQAAQFGAGAQNAASSQNQQARLQAMLSNQAAQNQFGLANLQGNLATQEANRAFAAQQQQQGFANTALLGQLQAGQTAAERAYQLQLLQAQAAMSFDPMQSILGRSSGSIGVGQQQQGVGAGLTQSMQGPQLFDPNAGINLALQNSANLGNYQSSTYGAQAGAQGAITGGLFQGIGSIIGGIVPKIWLIIMATFGQGINPALGRIDYSGYQQGAMMGAQGIGQGIAALGQAAGQAINQYYRKQEEKQIMGVATESVASAIKSNPALGQQFGIRDPNDIKAINVGIKAMGGGDAMKGAQITLQMLNQLRSEEKMNSEVQGLMNGSVSPNQATPEAVRQFLSMQAAQANIGKTLAETAKLGALPPPPDLSFQEQNLQAKVAAFVQANGRQPNAQEQAAMYSEVAGATAPRTVMTPEETLKLKEGELELVSANTAITGLQSAANDAQDALSKNSIIRGLLTDPETKTGIGQKYVSGLQALGVRFGLFNEQALSNQQKMEALINEDALKQTQTFLAKQGAVTEAERKRVEKIALDAEKTKGANLAIIEVRDATAQRLIDATKFVEAQREAGKSLTEANKALNKWYRENRLASYLDKQKSGGETKTETIEGIGTFVQDANGNWVRK